MSLSKKEIAWFEGLQSYLLTVPSSIKRKVRDGELSSYTTGDYDVVIFDGKLVSGFDDQSSKVAFDIPDSVDRAGAKIETLFFPFKIEIA